MSNWLEDLDCERREEYVSLAIAAVTAFSHGDEEAIDAVMSEVSTHPLELFITQTGLVATLVDVLASVTEESRHALLQSIALMLARRQGPSSSPLP
jgi:hypothetical protein